MALYFAVFIHILLVFTKANVLRPPIVGGQDANIEDYPWQVGVGNANGFSCGGSIISEKYIVTAAHCIKGISVVHAGANFSKPEKQSVEIENIIKHPKYSPYGLPYDIAILELKKSLIFSKSVNKIALPDTKELKDGTIVNVTGYGKTSEKRDKVQRLQVVQVPIVSRTKCQYAYEKRIPITEDMICAGVLGQGGLDACQGDSGGPLSHEGKLYGVVSWGIGCARPKYPGVYANVVYFLPFIKNVTGLGN